MPSNHLLLCLPLLLLPSIFPSIRIFSNESVLHIMWPKYWSFSFNIGSSKEHSGLISFRMEWLALLAVQGTLKSFLQHHSSKTSILWCSAFFTVQLSHPYMTTGKTIAARVQLQQPAIQPEEVNGVGNEAASHFSFGLPLYFKFKILFHTFTKTLGQRFDIFSSPSPRFIISINHCCSSEFLLH